MLTSRWSARSELGSEPAIRDSLLSLPRLRLNDISMRTCKICANQATVFDVVDFNKICGHDFYVFGLSGIPVTYYRCPVCSFVFTGFFDGWSATDFSRFIYNDDYAIVDPAYEHLRPAQTAAALSGLLAGCEAFRILDYGSGSGRFAAEMSARGFAAVTGYDPFSAPTRPQGKFDVITCLETIEHTVDPLSTLADMKEFLAEDGAVVISQSLQPPNIGEIRGNWWYIAPRNGHISIFAEDTFITMADRAGLVLRPGTGLYGFSRPYPSHAVEAALARTGPFVTTLLAPANPGEGWEGPEIGTSNVRFRWTRSAQVLWPAQSFRGGMTKIRLPFLMEITPGFAAACRVFAGGEPLPTDVTSAEIVARLQLPDTATIGIKLVTPEPLSPAALRGSPDGRVLGLAIRIADQA